MGWTSSKEKGQFLRVNLRRPIVANGTFATHSSQITLRTCYYYYFALLLATLSTVIGSQFIEPCGFSGSLSLFIFSVHYAVLVHCEK